MTHSEIKQQIQEAAEWTKYSPTRRSKVSWTDTGPIPQLSEEASESAGEWGDVRRPVEIPAPANYTIVEPDSSLLLKNMIMAIADMLSDTDPEMRPTDYALLTTLHLINEVGKRMKLLFPPGYVYGDGEKGIRIVWEHGNREVTIQVPNDGSRRQYLFHQEGEQHGIKEPLHVDMLVEWLGWLG